MTDEKKPDMECRLPADGTKCPLPGEGCKAECPHWKAMDPIPPEPQPAGPKPMEERVAQSERDIHVLDVRTAHLEAMDAANHEVLGGQKGAIDGLKRQMEELSAHVLSLAAEIGHLARVVDHNADALNEFRTAGMRVATDVLNLNSKVGNLASRVSTLEHAPIGQATRVLERLDRLEMKARASEEGLAEFRASRLGWDLLAARGKAVYQPRRTGKMEALRQATEILRAAGFIVKHGDGATFFNWPEEAPDQRRRGMHYDRGMIDEAPTANAIRETMEREGVRMKWDTNAQGIDPAQMAEAKQAAPPRVRTTCFWCGVEINGNKDMQRHVGKCKNSPMVKALAEVRGEARALRAENERLRAEMGATLDGLLHGNHMAATARLRRVLKRPERRSTAFTDEPNTEF